MYLFELEFCLSICPGVELLDHMAILLLVFWGTSTLFSVILLVLEHNPLIYTRLIYSLVYIPGIYSSYIPGWYCIYSTVKGEYDTASALALPIVLHSALRQAGSWCTELRQFGSLSGLSLWHWGTLNLSDSSFHIWNQDNYFCA